MVLWSEPGADPVGDIRRTQQQMLKQARGRSTAWDEIKLPLFPGGRVSRYRTDDIFSPITADTMKTLSLPRAVYDNYDRGYWENIQRQASRFDDQTIRQLEENYRQELRDMEARVAARQVVLDDPRTNEELAEAGMVRVNGRPYSERVVWTMQRAEMTPGGSVTFNGGPGAPASMIEQALRDFGAEAARAGVEISRVADAAVEALSTYVKTARIKSLNEAYDGPDADDAYPYDMEDYENE